MPVYEYVCPKCGKKIAELRAMKSADAPIACPSPTCHAVDGGPIPMTRVVSAPAGHFPGAASWK